MYDTRFACIVLLRPNIENPTNLEQSMTIISVSLIAEPMNTAVFVPYKSAGLKPASIIASTDLSKLSFVKTSMTSASFGCALKNIESNLSTFCILPVPAVTPSSSEKKTRKNTWIRFAPNAGRQPAVNNVISLLGFHLLESTVMPFVLLNNKFFNSSTLLLSGNIPPIPDITTSSSSAIVLLL